MAHAETIFLCQSLSLPCSCHTAGHLIAYCCDGEGCLLYLTILYMWNSPLPAPAFEPMTCTILFGTFSEMNLSFFSSSSACTVIQKCSCTGPRISLLPSNSTIFTYLLSELGLSPLGHIIAGLRAWWSMDNSRRETRADALGQRVKLHTSFCLRSYSSGVISCAVLRATMAPLSEPGVGPT